MSRAIQTTFNGLPLGRLAHVGGLGADDGTTTPNSVMQNPPPVADAYVPSYGGDAGYKVADNSVMAPDAAGNPAPLIPQSAPASGGGVFSFFTSLLAGGSAPQAPTSLDRLIAGSAQAQLADESRRRTITIVAVTGGMLAFGGLLYFLAKK